MQTAAVWIDLARQEVYLSHGPLLNGREMFKSQPRKCMQVCENKNEFDGRSIAQYLDLWRSQNEFVQITISFMEADRTGYLNSPSA